MVIRDPANQRGCHRGIHVRTARSVKPISRIWYEWLIEKHGTRTRRSWRKLHLGVDANTGQIVAAVLTDKMPMTALRSVPCSIK